MHLTGPRITAFTVAIALAGLAGGLLAFISPPSAARADSVIMVTTTAQSIDEDGSCSLAEAILAANHDSSVVPDPDGVGSSIQTACAAGSGADTIELSPDVYPMVGIVDEDHNDMGPTATPVITSDISIEGRGAVILRSGTAAYRAFAVGATGNLDLREVHMKDFLARGGDGGWARGGGGLGAGGAIYVHGGALTVQWSTFEGNGASGGNGGSASGDTSSTGGGGGGLGGSGGVGGGGRSAGGGGGGARGNGADGDIDGGGGGGTVAAPHADTLRQGGYRCGGDGGDSDTNDLIPFGLDGGDAGCAGGGGGGAAATGFDSGDGGAGAYGGGGGGGSSSDGSGGAGGFGGGGGGASEGSGSGGSAGFGAGGGGGNGGTFFGGPGAGGTFGGDGSTGSGGGGAGLGGAIFGHSATVTVSNSTFAHNYAVRGVAGCYQGVVDLICGHNGADAGGAIFTVGGTLTVTNSTIAGNESTGAGAGIVAYKPTTGEATSLVLRNTIVAGNTGRDECYLQGGVAAWGTNNLVTPHPTDAFTPCPTITQTSDPQLGALALNPPGRTPTMAIGSLSPAVNTGNLAFAPLDDQRGIARPQFGAADIGAYEFEGGTDVTAPRAAPAITSGSGLDGWSTTDVTVNWGWNDGVGSAGIDPEQCTIESTSTGEGSAIVLTATCTDLAGNMSTAEYTVKVDKTAPTVTCDPAPTYVVGGAPTTGLSATVTDAVSGPASSPVTAEVVATDLAEPGVFEKSLTGSDVAGNTMTVTCQYVVAYDFLGFLQPVPQSSYKRGSTIPVRFQLGDASGQPISDVAAAALISPTCLVFATLDGQTKGCATYSAVSNTFQFDVKTSKSLASGDHTVGILVRTVDGDIVNTDSTTVRLR